MRNDNAFCKSFSFVSSFGGIIGGNRYKQQVMNNNIVQEFMVFKHLNIMESSRVIPFHWKTCGEIFRGIKSKHLSSFISYNYNSLDLKANVMGVMLTIKLAVVKGWSSI